MNIALVVYSLAFPWGAEKVMSIMSNQWPQEGQHVTLLILDTFCKDANVVTNIIKIGVAGQSSAC